ncbi:hypothetical protein [Persicitalea jodogahamensis]|uniref:Uncharacterized protein n=1 Tax=Persicitalea jodogahamensis TaxID=402147 RepID=A0A8J3DCZ5_9BACT|nr:hypothetical protein [Persicitalea jodogahamensis]GHB78291.1 hypothetical protein GCM10007390_35690 [Persicitalea jodogahamensis]
MNKLILVANCLIITAVSSSAVYAGTSELTQFQVSRADTANFKEYAGKYKMQGTPFEYVELTAKDGKLHYVAGEYRGELLPKPAKDEFDANGQATVKFTRDTNGMINGMGLNAQGENFSGTRQVPEMGISSYVGKYKMEGLPFEYIELTDKSGKLHYVAGDNQGDLTALSGKDQFDANGQAAVNFTRDASDNVSTMVVNIQGQRYVGKREAAANSMAAYAGQYKMEGLPFETMEIKSVDGKLIINAMGDEGELTPLSAPDQFDAAGRATLKFTRNAGGQVTGVTLDAQGQSFGGVKK